MPTRAPFISIEGPDEQICKLLIYKLDQKLTKPSKSLVLYERLTAIGDIIARNRWGLLQLEDIVRHHLRIANLWEFQHDIRKFLKTKEIVTTYRYVHSNQIKTLVKGTLDIHVCRQLEVGLLKPDLQIILQPENYKNPYVDQIIALDPDISIIEYHTNSANQNVEEVLTLINSLPEKDFNEFLYYS